MSEPQTVSPPASPEPMLPLQAGERLDQKTFHERYEAMPEYVRAELIEGVVYMPSPVGSPHGGSHLELCIWLGTYKAHTPGTGGADNTTTILGPASEPQPDVFLRILPAHGGQTWDDERQYVHGAPELIAEASDSSEGFDLGPKFRDYQQGGVREYLVILVRRRQVRWFTRSDSGFVDLPPGEDGILRSEVFPGLWLDPEALLRGDTLRVLEVLNQGLATPEHAGFVEHLRRP